MKKLAVLVLVAAFAAFAWFSLPSPPRAGSEPASGDALAEGTVLALDRTRSSVTISHGPLGNLGMPAMTMGFQVAQPALLERIKPGDKVRFHPEIVGGELTVMNIEPAN